MSPFIKKQVLPRVAGVPFLVVGYWLGGVEGLFRTVGLGFAASNVFLIFVLWRPSARARRGGPLYAFTAVALGMTVVGLAIAGPLAPWLLAHAKRH